MWHEITVDTPIEEIKRIHKDIWNYVIEHGKKPETPYCANCIVCEYNLIIGGDCCDCSIIWPKNSDGKRVCYDVGGLFIKWDQSSDPEKTELARQIRDLPWKFESEEDS